MIVISSDFHYLHNQCESSMVVFQYYLDWIEKYNRITIFHFQIAFQITIVVLVFIAVFGRMCKIVELFTKTLHYFGEITVVFVSCESPGGCLQ